ncbi:PaaI family thioesterase [Phaeovulum sp. W22_SRMD_FR3]|uniref:PaaI family thioesterase n=1 Tax=Phaeovulum sp. W22_SRMD_FR3 TaxID=3240274 RepID=UPI003F962AFC
MSLPPEQKPPLRRTPEPVQIIKQRRDAALRSLTEGVPYIQFLGMQFDRRGDELTAILPFAPQLIGNPTLPAIHGGVTAAFLEVTAIIELSWFTFWEDMEAGRVDLSGEVPLPRLPKTIDFTVDYLRSGLPRDAYARARVNRSGRRYASVHVEAWQDNRSRLFAQATGHFLMPEPGESEPLDAGAGGRGNV